MYNPHSLRAEEFINHAEIMDTLEYARAHKDDKTLLSEILAKAALRKGLNHREAAVLLLCEDETVTEQMNRLARQIKLDFYGSRIVIFAPLYLSNYCVCQRMYLLSVSCQEQAYFPEKADPGGHCPGSHRFAGHGTQTARH